MLDIGPWKIFNNMHEHHFVAMNEFNEWMASYVWSSLQRDIHSCSAWSRQRHGCTHLAVGCNVKRSLYYMNGLFHTVRAVSLWSAWTASVFPAVMWQHLCCLNTHVLLDFEFCLIPLSFPASGLLTLSSGWLRSLIESRCTAATLIFVCYMHQFVQSAPHDFGNIILPSSVNSK